mmetsp:Transcript_4321/g.10665  ORF Transcript_4321/g.10665 Transcript_4321/m.10665 type:complete len:613 (+) Transcript_4321:595-2433(+)
MLGAQVGGEHDDRVGEVHGAALAVGEAAVVQHLQQHVPHVRMCLLHLVEEHHAVGTAAHGLGQLAALLVAHVAGRGAGEARHRVLLHVLAHVDAHHALLVEELLRERLGQLGLAHAGTTAEEEAAQRLVAAAESGAAAHDGLRHGAHRLVLAHHTLVKALLELQQALALALVQLGDRDAGPARHHLGHLEGTHLLGEQLVAARLLGLGGEAAQLTFEPRQLLVAELGGARQVVAALAHLDGALHIVQLLLHLAQGVHARLLLLVLRLQVALLLLQVAQLGADVLQARLAGVVALLLQRCLLHLQLQAVALQPIQRLGPAVQRHAHTGRRLVHQIDGLVRVEAARDVAVGQARRRHQRRVRHAHTVVRLVLGLEAAQDRHHLLDGRLLDQHLLEASLEGGVLLDVLAVLLQSGGTDAAQRTAAQQRLEQVGRVHRALAGGTRTHHHVDLVDEQDHLALLLLHLLQHRLESLLELSLVGGARDQRTQIQAHDARLQVLGHVAAHDALRQALHDRRLAHTRLTDQHRVVLGAAREHADHAPDLHVAADHRIELALFGQTRKVHTVLLERLKVALRLCAVHAVRAAHLLDGLLQSVERHLRLAKTLLHAVLLCHGQ